MATAMCSLNRIWQTRSLFARRACVAACIVGTAASGIPLSSRAIGGDESEASNEPQIVMPPLVVQADADGPQQSYVVPAAGLLDNWFSGQTSKVAKKESEDGRKATALPPPDPSSVNWNGIPFHQPNKKAPVDDKQIVSEPIRDGQRGATPPVPSSTANLRRPTTTVETPGRPISSTTRNTKSSIPPIPSNSSIPVPRVAPADSIPSMQTKSAATQELSSSNSTRRSGRRPVGALDAEAIVPMQNDVVAVPTEPTAMTDTSPYPSVPRRELKPLETPAVVKPHAKTMAVAPDAIPELPRRTDPTATTKSEIPAVTSIPEIPKAKADKDGGWDSVGSGVTPLPSKKETVAQLPPGATTTSPETPVVTDAKQSGPSLASERALREQFGNHALSPVERKPEATSKQLASSELPGVRVVTEGPSEIMIRELTQYEVRVENRGSFDATGIIVRSSLPAWAEVQGHNASIGSIKPVDQSGQAQLQWTIDKLPAGVVERMFVRVKAVKAGTFDVATDWTMMPQKHVAKITVREPKLSVVIDGPDEIIFGRSEKYRVRVMNPGDGDAANVVFTLSPESKSPQSQKIGTIPAGKEAQFEIELTARELGELKIAGLAVADREVKTDSNRNIRIAAANVEAELNGPPLKYQNTEAKYHLYVTNTGKAVCESINAELRLPTGVKYISGISEASMQGDRLTWQIDAMQPGAVREYDFLCKLDRTGDMVISFNCNGSAAGRASVSIETRVEAIADLVLSISDPVAPAPINTECVYEMTILNRGSKAAEEVRIVAQFSHGIEPIRVEGHNGEVVTGQALFSPIARIEPGSTVRLKVYAKADRAGDHRFRAEVRHGETSLVAEEATMFMNAPAERISRRSTDK